MTLRPADIRDYWPQIKSGVERALRDDDILPEEVYAACRAGKAFLYVADDAAFILRWSGKKEIRVWVSVGWGGNTLGRYDEEIARICREAGAESAVFTTCRKGFSRALPKTWKPVWTTYVRSL